MPSLFQILLPRKQISGNFTLRACSQPVDLKKDSMYFSKIDLCFTVHKGQHFIYQVRLADSTEFVFYLFQLRMLHFLPLLELSIEYYACHFLYFCIHFQILIFLIYYHFLFILSFLNLIQFFVLYCLFTLQIWIQFDLSKNSFFQYLI